ncbi:MAG TPA: gamma carbonic anhydrase family protein, partial [Clostridiales bacterium UBA8960]|nr:gamma carbonic anhydrase family protein [Clostridiales bacterium UBA8960]
MVISVKGFAPNIDESCFIADSSDVIGQVVVEQDANIWYNTVVRGDV